VKIVCISDTHQFHRRVEVPDGDVLIHAGDFSNHGQPNAIRDFNSWMAALPHKHKIVIAGNHDFLFQNHPDQARLILSDVTYLEDSGIEIEGVKFWGSPWSAEFGDWAFMGNEARLAEQWAKIPNDTQVLITHGPPLDIMDLVQRGERVGSKSLSSRLTELKDLKLHVFGHIHESYGIWQHPENGHIFVNASTCDVHYSPINPPIVVEL